MERLYRGSSIWRTRFFFFEKRKIEKHEKKTRTKKGTCLSLGIRFAGSANPQARSVILKQVFFVGDNAQTLSKPTAKDEYMMFMYVRS